MSQTHNLSEVIAEKLRGIADETAEYNVGRIVQIGDGIATVVGLPNVMYSELVIFENGVKGMAMNLEEDVVGIVLLGNEAELREGMEVRATGNVMDVPAGVEMLGRVVNALGEPIDGKGAIQTSARRPVEKIAPGVMERQSVNEPLQTGIKAIDAMIPIGKGQRELIIGDRQTGKTTIALDTIINQKGKDVYCIYVAIGQKNSTVASLYSTLQKHGAMEYTTIVSATASELAPLQYLAPYSGVAMAEELMAQGKDVLVVYDDLTKHAVAYRTISLLLRRPPGREAYPGDVFYLHSRLLERAARMNEERGGGSITALPIIETQAGDISAYIPTNVISITDGQIFLQTDLFNAGLRPAIDTGLSVSRVGGSAQTKIVKKLSGTIKVDLAQYSELQAFAQFSSDLDAVTKAVLDKGARLTELMKQPVNSPLSTVEEAIMLFAADKGYLKSVAVNEVGRYEKELLRFANEQNRDLVTLIETEHALTEEVEKGLVAMLDRFSNLFVGE